MSPIMGQVLRLSRCNSRGLVLPVVVDVDAWVFATVGDEPQLLLLPLPQPPPASPHSQSPFNSSAFGLARIDTLAIGQ